MFAQAVAVYVVEEIPFADEDGALARLRSHVARSRLLLVGEAHGAEQTPRAIYTLYRALGCRALALEWEPAMRPVVDGFLATGEIAVPDAAAPSFYGGAGTLTAGHFALLARLHDERMLDRLILLDDTPPTFNGHWTERSAVMAEALLRDRDDLVPTLAVVGAGHTKTEAGADGPPMGTHVRASVPAMAEARIDYCRGEISHFGTKSLPERAPRGPRLYLDDGVYVLELPEARPAVVPRLG